MKIIFSDDSMDVFETDEFFENSIFLAGPTPRDNHTLSWRIEALKFLEEFGYEGIVCVPEPKVKTNNFDYLNQVEWEYRGLMDCKNIAFWIPRNLKTLPGFTTNVEFGRYVDSQRCHYGRPDDAPNNRYLDWLYKKFNDEPIYNNLRDLIKHSIQ